MTVIIPARHHGGSGKRSIDRIGARRKCEEAIMKMRSLKFFSLLRFLPHPLTFTEATCDQEKRSVPLNKSCISGFQHSACDGNSKKSKFPLRVLFFLRFHSGAEESVLALDRAPFKAGRLRSRRVKSHRASVEHVCRASAACRRGETKGC